MKRFLLLLFVAGAFVLLGFSYPAEACACGYPTTPEGQALKYQHDVVDWVNHQLTDDVMRIELGEAGLLPPAPPGYVYAEDYTLVPDTYQ
jgi:hypothetical protein